MFWDEEDLVELKGTCVVGWFLLFFSSPPPTRTLHCHFHEAYTQLNSH